ncbi:MAG: protein phosphatase CheZ [Candidatus Accumulibacter meliphilus]|jgi:chemotaxis protein CheZ|uniref:Protein phosphatase CheZ n=1 Tax=Candidatus Accumulibacter meliphilus TaxID=2211374 RepID=A0A369XSP9_9PROT|nr:MAG: protein phosphatase CheZ [Candidatus Accumulibacter meliphilus]
MSDFDRAGDSTELEALFDSVAAAVTSTGTAAGPAATGKPSLLQQLREVEAKEAEEAEEADSDDLQALFEAVLAAQAPAVATAANGHDNRDTTDHESHDRLPLFPDPSPATGEGRFVSRLRDFHIKESGEGGEQESGNEKVFRRVGQMARQLHDTLGELGYHELLGTAAAAIPDTRDRLNYVASLTEKAACRVLNATDIANPLQDQLEASSAALAAKWDALYANQMGVEEFKKLADDTRAFLKQGLPQHTDATKAQLLEIMMAQDFQDLTGQVIKKTIAVAQELEAQLMGVLIETMPGERRTESVMSLLNGPVINAEGRSDVVATQQQVDDLLGSLGF